MKNNGVIYLLIFSLLTGMGGYFVKLTHDISSQQILFSRAVIACLFLVGYALLTRKTKELSLKYPLATFTMGLVEGLSIYFYYLALERTTITNTTLLVYTAPIFSVILASLFLKEKIERKTIGGIVASFLGVVVVSNPSQFNLGSAHMWGSLYALLGGFFYSAMAISSKSVTEKTTPLYAAFWQYFVIVILSAIFALPMSLQTFTANSFSLLYLGLIAGGIAFLLYMEGIKRVRGQVIQVITMMEIVIASLSGILLLGESISFHALVGGILILIGILIVSRKKT